MMMTKTQNLIKNKMDLCGKGKFLKINENDTANISVGKDMNNNYCLVIKGNSLRRKVNTSEAVSLELQDLGNNKKQLVFSLQKIELFDVFISFTENIYRYLYKEKNDVIEKAYKRWIAYRQLFLSNSKLYLSEPNILGLIGELLFLTNYMFKNYSVEKSILSWGGANYNKKDFEIDHTWYEIKTTTNLKKGICISSLEQLDSPLTGFLVIHELEKTTTTNSNAINLNNLVYKILMKINNPNIVDIFLNKLEEVGYKYDNFYKEYSYSLKETMHYTVNSDFPKLTRKSVPHGILECTYKIDINNIEMFRISK